MFELDAVSEAYRLFPDVIKGLFIRDSVRKVVDRRLEAFPAWSDQPPQMETKDWNRWLRLDSSEKPLMDQMAEKKPCLIPPEYVSDPEIVSRLDRAKPLWTVVPGRLLHSSMTVGRAHFYLELARELRIPLKIDPVRSVYLQSVLRPSIESLVPSTPEEAVALFVREVTAEDEDSPFVFDVNIPPVAELVLRYAQKNRISLYTAALEVRSSENARRFRDWCAQLFALRDEGGLRAHVEHKKMMKELEATSKAWAADVGEGVDYETRNITLGDIPLVGKILSAVGMDKPVIKDPVLRPKPHYRYFLFLNDLLRQPSGRTT